VLNGRSPNAHFKSMTLPTLAHCLWNKIGNFDHAMNVRINSFLNALQDDTHPDRRARARFNLFFLFIIAVVSITVAVVEVLG
jgi:hypothetical protein